MTRGALWLELRAWAEGSQTQTASSLKVGFGGPRSLAAEATVHKQPGRRDGSVVTLPCTGELTTGAIPLLQRHPVFTGWRQRRAVLLSAVQFATPKPPLGDADFSDLMVAEDPATRKAALRAQLADLKEVMPPQAACL